MTLQQLHSDALECFQAGLSAADPTLMIKKSLMFDQEKKEIIMQSIQTSIDNTGNSSIKYYLKAKSTTFDERNSPSAETENYSISRIFLYGLGKAAVPMTLAAEEILQHHLSGGLIITAPYSSNHSSHSKTKLTGIPILIGGHPIPNEDTVNSTSRLISLVSSNTSPDTLHIVLLSGGASALVELPPSPLTLEDIIRLNKVLLASGASIDEINIVRQRVSSVKGGRLAALAGKAHMCCLVLSDVIASPLHIIASGPTVASRESSNKLAISIIHKYKLKDSVPSIYNYIINHQNSKPPSYLPSNIHTLLIGSSLLALQSSAECIRDKGYNTLILTDAMKGSFESAADLYTTLSHSILSSHLPLAPPAAIIIGGEITVTLPNTTDKQPVGSGGRNQHLALLVSRTLPDQCVFLSAGTDGADGPTDAAGAIVTNQTVLLAKEYNMDVNDYLNRFDSYGFFKKWEEKRKIGKDNFFEKKAQLREESNKISNHIVIGRTGTNVMDIAILLVGSKPSSTYKTLIRNKM